MKAGEQILIKPLITEKSTERMDEQGQYAFVVDKNANKIQIREAVEAFYGVTVTGVRTMVMPAKEKVRFTTAGFSRGRKPAFKKAIITLADGESIDFYSNV